MHTATDVFAHQAFARSGGSGITSNSQVSHLGNNDTVGSVPARFGGAKYIAEKIANCASNSVNGGSTLYTTQVAFWGAFKPVGYYDLSNSSSNPTFKLYNLLAYVNEYDSTPSSPYTNFAKVTVDCPLTYNLNGGAFPSGTVVPKYYQRDRGVYGTSKNPTRSGYTFKNWADINPVSFGHATTTAIWN